MIKAGGENGNIGYVKKSDLIPDYETENGLEKFIGNNKDGKYIPVYDLDNNIIDRFFIDINC